METTVICKDKNVCHIPINFKHTVYYDILMMGIFSLWRLSNGPWERVAFLNKPFSTACATAHMLLHHSWQLPREEQATVCDTRFICLSLGQHQMTFLQETPFGTLCNGATFGKGTWGIKPAYLQCNSFSIQTKKGFLPWAFAGLYIHFRQGIWKNSLIS